MIFLLDVLSLEAGDRPWSPGRFKRVEHSSLILWQERPPITCPNSKQKLMQRIQRLWSRVHLWKDCGVSGLWGGVFPIASATTDTSTWEPEDCQKCPFLKFKNPTKKKHKRKIIWQRQATDRIIVSHEMSRLKWGPVRDGTEGNHECSQIVIALHKESLIACM